MRCPNVIFPSHRSASDLRAFQPDDSRDRPQRGRDPKPYPAAQAPPRHSRISLPNHGHRSMSRFHRTPAETRRRLGRGAPRGSGANAIAISRPAKHDERLASKAQDMLTGHGVRSARKSRIVGDARSGSGVPAHCRPQVGGRGEHFAIRRLAWSDNVVTYSQDEIRRAE